MANERIQIEIREDGSRVVKRNLEEVADTVEATDVALKLMDQSMKRLAASKTLPPTAVNEVRNLLGVVEQLRALGGKGLLDPTGVTATIRNLDEVNRSIANIKNSLANTKVPENVRNALSGNIRNLSEGGAYVYQEANRAPAVAVVTTALKEQKGVLEAIKLAEKEVEQSYFRLIDVANKSMTKALEKPDFGLTEAQKLQAQFAKSNQPDDQARTKALQSYIDSVQFLTLCQTEAAKKAQLVADAQVKASAIATQAVQAQAASVEAQATKPQTAPVDNPAVTQAQTVINATNAATNAINQQTGAVFVNNAAMQGLGNTVSNIVHGPLNELDTAVANYRLLVENAKKSIDLIGRTPIPDIKEALQGDLTTLTEQLGPKRVFDPRYEQLQEQLALLHRVETEEEKLIDLQRRTGTMSGIDASLSETKTHYEQLTEAVRRLEEAENNVRRLRPNLDPSAPNFDAATIAKKFANRQEAAVQSGKLTDEDKIRSNLEFVDALRRLAEAQAVLSKVQNKVTEDTNRYVASVDNATRATARLRQSSAGKVNEAGALQSAATEAVQAVSPGNDIIRGAKASAGPVQGLTASILKMGAAWYYVRRAIYALSGVFFLRELKQYADEWLVISNRIKQSTGTFDENKVVTEELYRISQRTRTDMGQLVKVYQRGAQAASDLGASQEKLLAFTEGVGLAMAIQGVSAEEAHGALLQLGQAISMARIRAQEFNSMNENAPRILKAVADNVDAAAGSITRLKYLVLKGDLTGRDFFSAFLKGRKQLEAEFKDLVPSLTQSFNNLHNAFVKYAGEMGQSTGAISAVSQALQWLAKNLDWAISLVLTLGVMFASTFTVSLYRRIIMIAEALATASKAMQFGTKVGIIVTVFTTIAVALYEFRNYIKFSTDSLGKFNDKAKETKGIVEKIQGVKVGTAPTPVVTPAAQQVVATAGTGFRSAGELTLDKRLDEYKDIIVKAAEKYNLPVSVLAGLIMTESAGNKLAVSKTGAQGLTQLMPKTAKYLGVEDAYDPEQNIMGGAKYLRELLNQTGNFPHALAAYNAGIGSLQKANFDLPTLYENQRQSAIKRGELPDSETEKYIPRILTWAASFGENVELFKTNLNPELLGQINDQLTQFGTNIEAVNGKLESGQTSEPANDGVSLGTVASTTWDAIKGTYNEFSRNHDTLMGKMGDLWTSFGGWVVKALKWVINLVIPIAATIQSAFTTAFRFIFDVSQWVSLAKSILNIFLDLGAAIINWLSSKFAWLWNNLVVGGWNTVQSSKIGSFFGMDKMEEIKVSPIDRKAENNWADAIFDNKTLGKMLSNFQNRFTDPATKGLRDSIGELFKGGGLISGSLIPDSILEEAARREAEKNRKTNANLQIQKGAQIKLEGNDKELETVLPEIKRILEHTNPQLGAYAELSHKYDSILTAIKNFAGKELTEYKQAENKVLSFPELLTQQLTALSSQIKAGIVERQKLIDQINRRLSTGTDLTAGERGKLEIERQNYRNQIKEGGKELGRLGDIGESARKLSKDLFNKELPKLDPLQAYIRTVEEETKAINYSIQTTEIQSRVQSELGRWFQRSAGDVTASTDAYGRNTAEIVQNVEAARLYISKVLQAENSIYSELNGRKKEYVYQQEAINKLLSDKAITPQQATLAYAKVSVEANEASFDQAFISRLNLMESAAKDWAQSVGEIFGEFDRQLVDGMADAIAESLVYWRSLKETIYSIATSALQTLTSALLKLGINKGLEAAIPGAFAKESTGLNMANAVIKANAVYIQSTGPVQSLGGEEDFGTNGVLGMGRELQAPLPITAQEQVRNTDFTLKSNMLGSDSRSLEEQQLTAETLKQIEIRETAQKESMSRLLENQSGTYGQITELATKNSSLEIQSIEASKQAVVSASSEKVGAVQSATSALESTSIASQARVTSATVANSEQVVASSAPAAVANAGASWGASAIVAASAIIALLSLITMFKGFETGGYTGDENRKAVAGVVHGQEFVVNATATKKNRELLEMMNSGYDLSSLRGFESGGYVGNDRPLAPVASSSNNGEVNISVHNYTPANIQVEQISQTDFRIIAREEAHAAVHREGPKMVANQMRNPNSVVSNALGTHTTAQRKRDV